MQTQLSAFRLAGVAARIGDESDTQELWKTWFSGSLKDELPAFSRTLYAVRYAYQSGGHYTLLLGKLVAVEASLPPNVQEIIVPPQCYRVFTLPENRPDAVHELWCTLEQDSSLKRCFKYDFSCFPSVGKGRVYVGVVGEVEQHETDFVTD